MKRIIIAILLVTFVSDFAFAERQLQQLPKGLRGFWYVVGFKDHRTGKYKKTSVNPEMFIYASGEQLHYAEVLNVKEPKWSDVKCLVPLSRVHNIDKYHHKPIHDRDYRRNKEGWLESTKRLYVNTDIGKPRGSFALIPITSVTRKYNFNKSRFEYTVVVREMNRIYVIYRNGKYNQWDGYGKKVRIALGYHVPREKQRAFTDDPKYLLKSYNLSTGKPVYTVDFLISEYDQYLTWTVFRGTKYSVDREEDKRYLRRRRSCFGRSGCCLLPNYK